MGKGKFKGFLNKLAKAGSKIPGPIGRIAQGVDDVIDDSQFQNPETTTAGSGSSNQTKSGPTNTPPAAGGIMSKIPMWGWIVGGAAVVFLLFKMMGKKKGGRYA